MNWEDHYQRWAEARKRPGQGADHEIRSARKRVAKNTDGDWLWLEDCLADANRKWFVASLFRFQPVPRRFFSKFLRAGILEPNPSLNRLFIEPCTRSLGTARVLKEILRYLETGTDSEKAGAASAHYWVTGNPRQEDLADLQRRIGCRMLEEFVANPDRSVRQRILPLLRLDQQDYPEGSRPLVAKAIAIARAHDDSYIRHRIEIQLGSSEGHFMAIPDQESRSAPN